MRADTHDQVFPFLPDCLADLEDGGGETGQMVSDLYPIEPNCCSELGFVDPENGHATGGGDFERAAVPKPVAVLPRYARVIDDCALGEFSVSDPVLNHHPAIELIDLWKGGLRRVCEARDRTLMVPDDRNGLRVFRILDVPSPVQ